MSTDSEDIEKTDTTGAESEPSSEEPAVAPAARIPAGKIPQGRVPDGKASDGKVPEGKVPDGRVPEGIPRGRPLSSSTDNPVVSSSDTVLSGVQQVVTIPLDEDLEGLSYDQLLARGDQAAMEGNHRLAIAAFEQAYPDNPTDPALLRRMVRASRELDDPVRLSRCLATLARLVDDAAEKADLMFQAAVVTRDGRGQPDKAVAGFNAAIDYDPDRLDAFLAITEIRTAQKKWSELEEAYRFMIGKHTLRDNPNKVLLSKLWRKLGTLLADEMENLEDASVALETATQIDPSDPKNHATRFALYRRWPGHEDEAIEAMGRLLEHDIGLERQGEDLRYLGTLLLQREERDAAWLCFRALVFLGEANEKETEFVAKLKPKMHHVPDVPLTENLWETCIYPSLFPTRVGRLLALLAPAVAHRLEHDLSHHGVKYGDRLDPDEPLLFNTFLKRVTKLFGLSDPPEVFVKDGVEGLGMINGILDPPGFIVDKSLLSGRKHSEVAFIVGRNLALMKQNMYLAGISPLNNLEVFVMGATKFVRPDSAVPLSKDIGWVVKSIGSRLSEDQQKSLRTEINALIEDGVIELETYLRFVDQTVNRLALIVSDDLEVAADCIMRGTAVGPDDINTRLDLLVRYSVSNEYMRLRKQIGMTVGK